MKNILVPMDSSDNCNKAAKLAIEIAAHSEIPPKERLTQLENYAMHVYSESTVLSGIEKFKDSNDVNLHSNVHP